MPAAAGNAADSRTGRLYEDGTVTGIVLAHTWPDWHEALHALDAAGYIVFFDQGKDEKGKWDAVLPKVTRSPYTIAS